MSGDGLLSGLRILDFSRVLAGPFCTALLADVGAEVIKVESHDGDDYRHVGPPRGGDGAYFLLANRGKKSVVIDLKSEAGRELAVELAARCDAVVENFRPGVAERLGIGHANLSARNPGLVYLSISGFGQQGAFAGRPSYDIVAQAMSGIMHTTGEADGPPTLLGESLGDLGAGLYAAWALVSALLSRERERAAAGEAWAEVRGRRIDMAMFDALFALQPSAHCQYFYGGRTPGRVGNRHPLSTPFGVFAARDGHVVIAVLNDALFARLAEAIDQPGLADDPRFRGDASRTAHEPLLRALIEDWTATRGAAEVVERLTAAGVPVAPIWDMDQAVRQGPVAERELVTEVEHARAGRIALVEQPAHFEGLARGRLRPPPMLGEHTAEVLHGLLGLPEEVIAGLVEHGVAGGVNTGER